LEQALDLTWVAVADLAAGIGPPGVGLLSDLADRRLEMYAGGHPRILAQVDIAILKQLAAVINAQKAREAAVVRRFAQLYSYVIQYLARSFDTNDRTRQALISVVLEVEDKCIAPAIAGYQFPIRKAIQSGDANALMAAHDAILGSQAGPGVLASVWVFDYGPDQTGRVRHWPQQLPAG
jgi:hypothetical protein